MAWDSHQLTVWAHTALMTKAVLMTCLRARCSLYPKT